MATPSGIAKRLTGDLGLLDVNRRELHAALPEQAVQPVRSRRPVPGVQNHGGFNERDDGEGWPGCRGDRLRETPALWFCLQDCEQRGGVNDHQPGKPFSS